MDWIMDLKIGFTGTQAGMSLPQKNTFTTLILELMPDLYGHGDCIGADEDSHYIVRATIEDVIMVGFPPIKSEKRAFCRFDILNAPRDYIPRNHDIVDWSDIMIATPYRPETLRSGTWATIRYARKRQKNLYIITRKGKILHSPHGEDIGDFLL